MESSELYHVKQQFTLGAYSSLLATPLPSSSAPDYYRHILYHARASIALSDIAAALKIIPSDSESTALRATSALARYVENPDEIELEALRDLCVEVEGETGWEEQAVRVLAGTAFARAGEVEEALESLGAGIGENLEAVAVTVQVYVSINRPDLAKKEFDRAKKWAEDDLLLGLIESIVGLSSIAGESGYSSATSFATEQLGNPSLKAPKLLTSRAVARLMKGEVGEARSDLEEAKEQLGGKDAETEAAIVVASGLGAGKKGEADELWAKFSQDYPSFPMVRDVEQKFELFDECASKFEVPSLAVATAA